MSIFDDLKAAHNSLSNHERTQNRHIECSSQHPMLLSFMLEQAMKGSGAIGSVNPTVGGLSLYLHPNTISADYQYTYPEKMITEHINQMKRSFASGWSQQTDGSWIKMTDDFLEHYTTQVLYPQQHNRIIEEATFEDEGDKLPDIKGICMPDDAAMNEFAAKVGFESPVRQK